MIIVGKTIKKAMSDQRDDATNDKIDLRSKMKEIIKIQRERKGNLSNCFPL